MFAFLCESWSYCRRDRRVPGLRMPASLTSARGTEQTLDSYRCRLWVLPRVSTPVANLHPAPTLGITAAPTPPDDDGEYLSCVLDCRHDCVVCCILCRHQYQHANLKFADGDERRMSAKQANVLVRYSSLSLFRPLCPRRKQDWRDSVPDVSFPRRTRCGL